MAVMFTNNLSWWSWSGKGRETSNSSLETLRFPSQVKTQSAWRRRERKWHSREERRIDKEYDIVLVPSDGGCLSGSDSGDDSDWSIGWMEPHAPDFKSNNEMDASFAVLVPCYSHGRKDQVDRTNNKLPGGFIARGHSTESKGILEQWLSSLPNT